MKNKFGLVLIFTSLILQIGCTQQTPTDLTQTAFIPKPASVIATGEAFELKESTTIYYEDGADELETVANYLASEISRISGMNLTVETTTQTPKKGIFIAANAENKDLNKEGYELDIVKKLISIKGNAASGCFYGVQTLLQIIPEKTAAGEALVFATGSVKDFPEYGFRGAMLDVSRHFFTKEEVKKFIDYLAKYKMNILHLHLSDDQGWRIEIKSRPKLTEIGGSTEVGGGEGGFYTQEEYSELVKYAADRQITVIPEIDMPGHTNAALASYAELNCDGKARDLYTGTDVGFSTFCTDKDEVYEFLDDVIREIAALTPGPYIHIGGDESHVTAHDDYVYFVNRVQQIVLKYGKKIIGWDEIANATPVDGATVQFWADVDNTTLGVEKGTKVIMSPAKYAYLDMQYDSTSQYGLHWAGYVEVDHGYSWDPATLVPGITKEKILGVEAPLWSETVSNLEEAEYLVFPRLPGYAEIAWTAPENRNWDDYKMRLAKHSKRFKDLGIDFYESKLVPWEE